MANQRVKPDKPVRLMIDFRDANGLIDFVQAAKREGLIPEGFGVFTVTSLDYQPRSGGIGRRQSFVMRKEGDEMRERFTVTTTRNVTL